MNRFQTSDQADFDKIAATNVGIRNSVNNMDSSVNRLNSTMQSGFSEQHTLLSRIRDGIGGVGNGIANIYRNNKQDYGINKEAATTNIAAMATGPIGAAIRDAINNSGISIGGVIKKSIGGVVNMFHGRGGLEDLGEEMGELNRTESADLGIQKQQLNEEKKQTDLQQKQLESATNNASRIVSAIEEARG